MFTVKRLKKTKSLYNVQMESADVSCIFCAASGESVEFCGLENFLNRSENMEDEQITQLIFLNNTQVDT